MKPEDYPAADRFTLEPGEIIFDRWGQQRGIVLEAVQVLTKLPPIQETVQAEPADEKAPSNDRGQAGARHPPSDPHAARRGAAAVRGPAATTPPLPATLASPQNKRARHNIPLPRVP
jgi:hypothetical protein